MTQGGLVAVVTFSMGLLAVAVSGCGKPAKAIASLDDFQLGMSHEAVAAGLKRGCAQCTIKDDIKIGDLLGYRVKGLPSYEGITFNSDNEILIYLKNDKIILIGSAFDFPSKTENTSFYNKLVAIHGLTDAPEKESTEKGTLHTCRHKNLDDTQVNVCRNEGDDGRYTVGMQRTACVELMPGSSLCEH